MRISDWSSDVCSSDLLHPMTMGRQIIEQCVVRYRDAMRKSRRSAAILQIADFVRTGLGQRRLMRLQSQEILISAALHITCPRRVAGPIGQFGRIEQHPRHAAFKLHGTLIAIAFLAAKATKSEKHTS